MSLTLDERECEALSQALDWYLPQLRLERARAAARETQHELSRVEEILESIRRRLAAGESEVLRH